MSCKELLSLVLKGVSVLFLYPKESKDLLKKLRNDGSQVECIIEECSELNNLFRKTLSEMNSLEELELEREYTRLFISSYPQTPCPPYESVYVGENRLLSKREVIGDIYAILNAMKLDMDRSRFGTPDHISVELELAHLLVLYDMFDPLGAKAGIDLLLKKHLSNWLPKFSECIKLHSTNDFYLSLSRLLDKILLCINRIY